MALSVAGGVVGAEALLLSLLLLELLAGAGAAAEGSVSTDSLWKGVDGTHGVLVKEGMILFWCWWESVDLVDLVTESLCFGGAAI